MLTRRTILIAARVFFGLLGLLAIGVQLSVHIENNFSIVNFFSYFTNLSNLLAAAVLLTGAYYLIKRRNPTVTDDITRGAVVVAMALVGIVYGLLLRNEDLGTLLPWVNIVLHYIMPVAVAADWLYQPPKTKLVTRQALWWLVFPLVYLVYSTIRGAVTHWYAYPFFNPDKVGGYGGVVLYCIGIMLLFFSLSWLLLKLANIIKRHVS